MRTGGFVVMVTIATITLKRRGHAQGNHFDGVESRKGEKS